MPYSNDPLHRANRTLKGVSYLVIAMALSLLAYTLLDGSQLAQQVPAAGIIAAVYFIVLGTGVIAGFVRYGILICKRR